MALLMKPEPFAAGELSRLFNTLFDASELQGQRWSPPVDLVEGEDHFVLKADLPGLCEADISIEIQDNTLTLSGERHADQESPERGWYRVERSFGRFSRSLTLPEGVDPEGVSAVFDEGVLEVRVPKPERRKPRRVQIGVGSGNANADPAVVEGTAEER